jgi:branched-chain amino acid transport system ATP-binding protein
MILTVEGLDVRYGATRAVRGLSCRIAEGEIVALIGANGAGKSTFLRALAGLHRPHAGTIRMSGQDITRLPAHKVARRGLCLVPEGRQLFTDLTVEENLTMGLHPAPVDRRTAAGRFRKAVGIFPVLGEFADRRAGTLSGGQQQMVAIGRALMGEPRILLLDEPSLGLAPKVVTQILAVVGDLAATGITVVLAEQNAAAALRTANRGLVLSNGTIAHSATADELLADEEISRHYLGGGSGREQGSADRRLPGGLDRLVG